MFVHLCCNYSNVRENMLGLALVNIRKRHASSVIKCAAAAGSEWKPQSHACLFFGLMCREACPPSSVTPQSWSPSTVQTGALTPGVCLSMRAAGVSSCTWSWWRPRREAGAQATGEGEAMDWTQQSPWEGSQSRRREHTGGVPLSCGKTMDMTHYLTIMWKHRLIYGVLRWRGLWRSDVR